MDPMMLTVAFALGYIAYRLGLPPLVGFLLAGLGLSALGYRASAFMTEVSDLGVTLLLFTIGLKLKIRNLTRPEVWAGASVHMGLTTVVLAAALLLLARVGLPFLAGMTGSTALLLAFALCFSSTVFAVKVLDESGRADSLNGRTAIGMLIIQDVVAVVYLTVSTGKLPSIWALAVIALLPVAGRLFFAMMSRVGHGELMTLFGLFLALIAGAVSFERVGLKPDLGALVLGMMVANHPRAKEMAEALMSIKDLLLVGFFLTIGLTGLPDAAGLMAAGLLVLLLPLKLALYFFVLTRFNLKSRTAFATTMNLANYSEFGLIVGALAVAGGQLDARWLVIFAISLSVSLIVASPLNKQADRIFEFLRGGLKRCETGRCHPEEEPYPRQPWQMIVVGMGRIGVGAYDWLEDRYGKVVLGIDFSAETVARWQGEGKSVQRADITDPELWRRLLATDDSLRLVVLALANPDAMCTALDHLRRHGYKGKVVAVAQYDDQVERLRQAGADLAINVFREAGAGMAAHAAELLPMV